MVSIVPSSLKGGAFGVQVETLTRLNPKRHVKLCKGCGSSATVCCKLCIFRV